MLKLYSSLIALTLITLCSNATAQYTQMIVDNNNRIMPIFFHDNETLVTLGVESTHFQETVVPPTYEHAAPLPVLPNNFTHPVTNHHRQHNPPQPEITRSTRHPNNFNTQQPRNLPRNPLTGPYFLSPERHRILDAAYASLGTPYIYGGNNPAKGLDCSSLMQHIHKQATGANIPRTAAQQRNRSKPIAYQDLQPGDMLFFKIDRRNNHVGIYIGDGKFIHASSSNKRASIASMERSYWKQRFVKFGSYLNS